MQRLGQAGPEVPVVVGAAQAGARVALDGVVQVGEFQRVTQEEDRGVVAHQIPVAFLGIELHRETTDIALGIGRAALAGYRRETQEQLGFLADFREQLGARVLGDVMRDGEGAVGARPLGVHAALGNHLAVEVGQLFQEPYVLQQGRAARTSGLNVLVVDDGRAESGRKLVHDISFVGRGC
ncbi:hypothetical protein D3C87_1341860 [compost metagenome]